MTWVFERGAEQLTWEVRRAADTYEIAVQQANGRSRVHQVGSATALIEQIDAVPQALLRAGWKARPVRATLDDWSV
jgi:hypothetical protein